MSNHLKECKICDDEFDPTLEVNEGGYVNICGECDEEDIPLSVGLIDTVGKSDVRLAIFSNPTAAEVKFVRRQGMSGPSQCNRSLQLESNGSTTSKDKLDNVQKKLYSFMPGRR